MNDDRRVAVTGIGLVTAIGQTETTVWENLLCGRTGLRSLRNPALADNHVRHGAEVDVPLLEPLVPPSLRRADRTVKFAAESGRQALIAAGYPVDGSIAAEGIATLCGCGCGPTETLFTSYGRFAEKGAKGMRPSTVPSCMANSLSAALSIHFQLTGSNYTVASACTSSTNALGIGFRMIRDGHVDAVLCVGADSCFDPFHYGCWNNLGVFSTVAEPERAVRPFAADRNGTLLGEGAGALLLESFARARRRGVRIRGEIAGYGESSDATHITGPSAAGQARAIRAALASAGIAPDAIGYVNAHGTGTEANDLTEAQAIREAFGPATEVIPVGATKSFFGHTLGASGAIETIGTLLALEERRAPPNLNLETPDPACPVRVIGASPEAITGEYAMKNSFGFGGGNAVLVLRRVS